MIARMVDERGTSSFTKPRRLGYLIGLGIVVIILVAGILGWSASGNGESQASAWLAAMLLILTGLGVIAMIAAIALNRIAEKNRTERRSTAASWTVSAGGEPGRASRDQAALIAAWYIESAEDGGVKPRLAVRNASPVPVSRAHILIHDAGDLLGKVPIGLLPPNVEPMLVELPDDVLQKISTVRASGDARGDWMPEVDLLFLDAAGVTWWRTSAGLLKQRRLSGPGSPRSEGHPEA